jgi:N-ethylmaleimide reductase
MSLFRSGKLGDFDLPNRLVVAPMGRGRSDKGSRQPLPRVASYYAQRASAGLIIAEGTHVAAESLGRPGTSAIYNDAQTDAWRTVTTAVHDAGGVIFLQLYHLGRKAHPYFSANNVQPIAPSAIAATDRQPTAQGEKAYPVPRALLLEEIPERVRFFRQAVIRAKRAGFDGVEIHAANGFLIDQFLRDGSNQRRDHYGGGPENRARFLLEVVDAAIEEIGAGRVGVRISPHFRVGGIDDSNPAALFAYVAEQLQARAIAYLHLIEPQSTPQEQRLAADLRQRFTGAFMLAGEFDRASALSTLEQGHADFIAFGRLFISNPDLVERLRRQAALNPPDESSYYVGDERGYLDYPTLEPSDNAAEQHTAGASA